MVGAGPEVGTHLAVPKRKVNRKMWGRHLKLINKQTNPGNCRIESIASQNVPEVVQRSGKVVPFDNLTQCTTSGKES